MSYGNRQVYDDVCRLYFSSWYGDLRTRLGVEIEDHTDYTNFRFFTCCCIDQNNTFSYGCHTHAWVQSKGYDVACDAVINGSQWVGDGGWSYIRIDKTHSAQTPTFKAHTTSKTVNGYGGIPAAGNTIEFKPFTVSARPSYAVSYDANGGSGAPSSQTKWYGDTLTLSSTTPTREGYTFQGWATSSTGSVAYGAGASYTGNSTLALYAVWKANTWTVSYDANGGAGAPTSQTKTYGQTLTLSSTNPTRANYTFLGWATSASATTAEYQAGGSYTANQGAVLYAVWKLAFVAPKVSMTTPFRCDSAGAASDTGTQCATQVTWSVDTSVTPSNTATAVKAELVASSGTVETIDLLSSAGSTTGATQTALFTTTLDEAGSYGIKATVTDSNGLSSVYNAQVPQAFYVVDFNSSGKGVAFGKPSTSNTFAVSMPATFDGTLSVAGAATVSGNATVKGTQTVGSGATAALYLKTTDFTSRINAYNADKNGHNIIWQSGANMILGAGESAQNLYSAASLSGSTSESLYLTADNNVYFASNCNTIANRKTMTLNTSGNLSVPGTITAATEKKTMASGFYLYRFGKVVHMVMDGYSVTSNVASGAQMPFTLPSGWRPDVCAFVIFAGSGVGGAENNARFDIRSTGNATFYDANGATLSAGSVIWCSTTYITV